MMSRMNSKRNAMVTRLGAVVSMLLCVMLCMCTLDETFLDRRELEGSVDVCDEG